MSNAFTGSAFVEEINRLRFHKPDQFTKEAFAVWRPVDNLAIHFQKIEVLTTIRDEMTKTIEEWAKYLEENR